LLIELSAADSSGSLVPFEQQFLHVAASLSDRSVVIRLEHDFFAAILSSERMIAIEQIRKS